MASSSTENRFVSVLARFGGPCCGRHFSLVLLALTPFRWWYQRLSHAAAVLWKEGGGNIRTLVQTKKMRQSFRVDFCHPFPTFQQEALRFPACFCLCSAQRAELSLRLLSKSLRGLLPASKGENLGSSACENGREAGSQRGNVSRHRLVYSAQPSLDFAFAVPCRPRDWFLPRL
jgi:hypothetical protein